ncbi:hypothetical protein [Flaviaesturariibacter amylovorans]|uniref:AAA family ATPase n=1 Tax=Flaviaesturariibacter amylovorans TaxID=1084520 RepID=A0ABP8H6E1_9BACT
MKLNPATQKKQKLRLSLEGQTYTGKTLSALLVSYGLAKDWSKTAIIDTEHHSASFYNWLGPFNTIQISAPYRTEKYIDAIDLCESAGIEVIIVDSISPEWVGEGGILDVYCSTPGSRAQKRNNAFPQHHAFMSYLLESTAHIITTVRVSGSRLEQDLAYRHNFHAVVSLDQNQEASVVKDRTGILKGECPCKLSLEIGSKLLQWCNQGEDPVSPALQGQIDSCRNHEELQRLMISLDMEDMSLMSAFTRRRLELDGIVSFRQIDNSGPKHPPMTVV